MYRQPLTARQKEFLEYLRQEMEQTGQSPSLRVAAGDQGISHTAVASLLQTLEEKGWVKREGRYSRTIRLTDHAPISSAHGRSIPIIGRVAAGLPLYAQQDCAGFLVVDENIYRGERLFALRIQGDSMTDIGILDQDLVICEPRQFAENGEIVVALVHDDEATVKRFFHYNDHIELRPENKAYPVQRYTFSEVLIQGKVIGLHRGPDKLAIL